VSVLCELQESIDIYVKSPVASGCLSCSSVKRRVRVTISVLIDSEPTAPGAFAMLCPLVAMMS
jgi:hypothetical protein